MKKYIILALAALTLSCSACSSSADKKEIEQMKQEIAELKQQVNSSSTEDETQTAPESTSTSDTSSETNGLKNISVGETVSVSTKRGDFEISIDNVHKTDIYDDTPDTFAATVQCVVKNISFSSDLYENKLTGYDIAKDNNFLQLSDKDGAAFPFYSIAGPTDGAYAVAHELPIGGKSKESYPFLVPVGTTDVSVIIDNKYILNTTINN